ncbi:hydroxyethylthiazole kinase [Anaerotalea alkaliphila]|uniref:Hydroxyethylthiazole kinase n=1 Tax=Anaerotalea alkaliphila TaxID=2662126 RepID=A0A7X5HVX9_9FIRM|nr:hydroxyethylthiazole kinase [Anaerotalea alkaliphila]NDL67436.1 hydroxyethylthiazole kinase [Anaerotalea alkaliphila]
MAAFDLQGIIGNTRKQKPLVHSITNYVTAGDCANILLACGASPIMADDRSEVEEITALAGGLVLNIGTLNSRTVESMLLSGRKANALGIPVVLDPVGAGATALRTEAVGRLLSGVRFSLIRGNISEILAVHGEAGNTGGVDASWKDRVTEENLEEVLGTLQDLAGRTGAVLAVTGALDLVVDGERALLCRNGHPQMGGITGMGCMLSAVAGAFAAANPERVLEAAAAAVVAMGICGEQAQILVQAAGGGTGTMKAHLLDRMCRMEDETVEEEGRYEIL